MHCTSTLFDYLTLSNLISIINNCLFFLLNYVEVVKLPTFNESIIARRKKVLNEFSWTAIKISVTGCS